MCLAALHKGRLKDENILRTQPISTIEQVGPRGILQYGALTPTALTGFLFWRKWFYDIDNRAAQETGYIFEPIIANAIGGTPAPSKKSPVKRRANGNKGRQVDCVKDKRAYELKRYALRLLRRGKVAGKKNSIFPRTAAQVGTRQCSWCWIARPMKSSLRSKGVSGQQVARCTSAKRHGNTWMTPQDRPWLDS